MELQQVEQAEQYETVVQSVYSIDDVVERMDALLSYVDLGVDLFWLGFGCVVGYFAIQGVLAPWR